LANSRYAVDDNGDDNDTDGRRHHHHHHLFYLHIQGGPKNWHNVLYNVLYALTLPNINRFSKLFHCQNQEKICNNIITRDPTTPQLCRYTTMCPIKAPRRGVLPSSLSVGDIEVVSLRPLNHIDLT